MHEILQQTFTLVTQAAVATISGVLLALLAQALRRFNLNLSAQQEAQVRYFAERAVHIAEETVVDKGAPKLAAAVELVRQKLPSLPYDEIANAIHAELARQRADVGNELFQPKK